METKYRRGLDHTYLILELPILYEEDYQMKMMRLNRIEGLLMAEGQGVDEKSQYFYEISGKVSLRSLYGKTEISGEELQDLLIQILKVVNTVQKYMMDAGKLLFEPEYIFYEEGKYEFCYLPVKEADLCREFHKLTEYFVSRINHEDQDGMKLAYELHKVTMEENYNLEKTLEKIKTKKEKRKKKEKSYEIPEMIITDMDYQREDYNSVENSVFRESSFGWGKRKKGKWGDWEEKL